ncbi:MAG: hypothetical protein JXR70_04025 [Spirochaetales bacterium]|nr:hypothetical protein [Spirochaetales bacterium]
MKEILFSLGVFFGLIAGFDDPSINALIIRDNTHLILSASIENSDHEKIREMVDSGNLLKLTLEIILKKHGTIRYVHEIAYDPILKEYKIKQSETASSYLTKNPGAAFLLWTQFDRLGLWPEAEVLMGPLIFVIIAELDLSEPSDADPRVLWNYVSPQKIIRYNSLKEVSY